MTNRFCTYEHKDNAYEPAVMSQAEFDAGGRITVDEADAFVWHFAPDAEAALKQHNAKFDEWSADVEAGRPEKRTY